MDVGRFRMRVPLAILMTATVDPGEYSGQIDRTGSNLRTRDYLEAIKFWATHPDPRIESVVFCENSGADLRAFEGVAGKFPSTRRFEVLGFRGNTRPHDVHYGYAELGIIDYACEKSMLLQNCRHFAKATGRYLFPGISLLIESLDEDLLAAVDCRRAYRRESGVRLRARTQLMIFEREFYKRVLAGTREQMLGNCSHIEEFLAQKLLPLYRHRTRGVYLRWKVECPALGYDAGRNKNYGAPRERIKNAIRATCRRIMPDLWL
jgi:hypothetical protein